jgi:Trypsin
VQGRIVFKRFCIFFVVLMLRCPASRPVGHGVVVAEPGWTATVRTFPPGGWCSASVLSKAWIVTAKHCVTDETGKLLPTVVVSINPLLGLVPVLDVKLSPDPVDIALLHVPRLDFAKALPLSPQRPRTGSRVSFYGYGCTANECHIGLPLRKTKTEQYRVLANGPVCGLCVSAPGADSGPGPGDSGGPWVIRTGRGFEQVGLFTGAAQFRNGHVVLTNESADTILRFARRVQAIKTSVIGQLIDTQDGGTVWEIGVDGRRRSVRRPKGITIDRWAEDDIMTIALG